MPFTPAYFDTAQWDNFYWDTLVEPAPPVKPTMPTDVYIVNTQYPTLPSLTKMNTSNLSSKFSSDLINTKNINIISNSGNKIDVNCNVSNATITLSKN